MGELIQSWDSTTAFSLPIENTLLGIFKTAYPLSEKVDNWTADIDTHDEEVQKIEIKAEEIAAQSKRFWCEVSKTTWENDKRIEIPSGLFHTESKWWIQIDISGQMFLIKTAALQQFVNENKDKLEYLKDIKTNQGGYYTYNNCYVIYYKQIQEFSRWYGNIEDFSPELLKKVIL